MPYNGSGTFTRLMSWSNDALAGIKIKADRHDQEDDNFASGLTNAITKDGQTQPTADIPFNGKRITNLGTPTIDTDAATKAYADLPKPFTTGATISGADINGRLNFTSPTGTNGLTFTGADLSWLARLAGTPAGSNNRMVLNDKPDGSGTDVATINDTGNMSITGNFTANGGQLIAQATSAQIKIVPTTGNGHVWWYAADGTTTRMILYTSGGAQGSGNLTVGGTNFTFGAGGTFTAPAQVYAAGAYLNTDGNVVGGVWSNWGASDAYSAIGARIEARATAWANDRVANLQYRRTSLGAIGVTGGTGNTDCPAGAVLCGVYTANGGDYLGQIRYVYLQVYDPVRGWVGFSG